MPKGTPRQARVSSMGCGSGSSTVQFASTGRDASPSIPRPCGSFDPLSLHYLWAAWITARACPRAIHTHPTRIHWAWRASRSEAAGMPRLFACPTGSVTMRRGLAFVDRRSTGRALPTMPPRWRRCGPTATSWARRRRSAGPVRRHLDALPAAIGADPSHAVSGLRVGECGSARLDAAPAAACLPPPRDRPRSRPRPSPRPGRAAFRARHRIARLRACTAYLSRLPAAAPTVAWSTIRAPSGVIVGSDGERLLLGRNPVSARRYRCWPATSSRASPWNNRVREYSKNVVACGPAATSPQRSAFPSSLMLA